MSNRMGVCLFLLLIVAQPVSIKAAELTDLTGTSIHDLQKIQDRLKLKESIRATELNILKMEEQGNKLSKPTSHSKDLTKPPFAPVKKEISPPESTPKPEPKNILKTKLNFTKKRSPVTVVKVEPISVQSKKTVKPKSRPKKKKTLLALPKIVSIKGGANVVYADLELAKDKGTIRVYTGDPILAGAYTVSTIDHTGVIVSDKKGKAQRLAFKTAQQVPRTSKKSSFKRESTDKSSRYRPVSNSLDSTMVPKD